MKVDNTYLNKQKIVFCQFTKTRLNEYGRIRDMGYTLCIAALFIYEYFSPLLSLLFTVRNIQGLHSIM